MRALRANQFVLEEDRQDRRRIQLHEAKDTCMHERAQVFELTIQRERKRKASLLASRTGKNTTKLREIVRSSSPLFNTF